MSNAARKARKKQHHDAVNLHHELIKQGLTPRFKVVKEAKQAVESTRFVSDKGQRERQVTPKDAPGFSEEEIMQYMTRHMAGGPMNPGLL